MIIYQCKFRPFGEEAWQGGIYVNINLEYAYIICGCCGAVFEMDDIADLEIFDDWVNLSEEIIGD